MRIVMNSYILFKLNLQTDKTVNKQVLEPKHYQGEKRKIFVFALTVKKQKFGINILKWLTRYLLEQA